MDRVDHANKYLLNERKYDKISALPRKSFNQWEHKYFKVTVVLVQMLIPEPGTFYMIPDYGSLDFLKESACIGPSSLPYL